MIRRPPTSTLFPYTTRSTLSSATRKEKTMIVHKTVTIARPPDVAFKIFVEEIGQWWPLDKYSFLGPEATLILEPREGGRFYETAPDGREYVIGEVLHYEPGVRLTYTWTGNVGVTEVDIR